MNGILTEIKTYARALSVQWISVQIKSFIKKTYYKVATCFCINMHNAGYWTPYNMYTV